MTGRFLAPGVVLLLAVSGRAPAQDLPSSERYVVRAEYTRWGANLSGHVQKGFGSEEGTLLDLADDLGVQSRGTWQVKATARIGSSFKLRGSYVPLDKYRGDVIAKTNFSYGTEIYHADTRVLTSIDGKYYTGEFEWDFQRGQSGFFGVLAGVKIFDVSSVVVAPLDGKRVIQADKIPIPVVGVAGRTYYGRRFSMEGELSGMTIGSRGKVWELNLYARVNLSDRLAVGGGFHRVTLKGRDERDSVNIRLGGWQYGLELSI
jgi:hypothetical protein